MSALAILSLLVDPMVANKLVRVHFLKDLTNGWTGVSDFQERQMILRLHPWAASLSSCPPRGFAQLEIASAMVYPALDSSNVASSYLQGVNVIQPDHQGYLVDLVSV